MKLDLRLYIENGYENEMYEKRQQYRQTNEKQAMHSREHRYVEV